jgi:cytochrome c peroxidase
MQKIIFLLLSLLLLISCSKQKEKSSNVDVNLIQASAKKVFATLPKTMPGSENDTPELIELGKKLYFETKLSVNDKMSCNTCHKVDNNGAGVDNLPTSPGAKEGTLGTRNSPTVLNAGFQFAQFWDGREPDLASQAKGPVLNPVEMGMPSAEVVETKISKISEYKELFKKAYPDDSKITFDKIADAIAAFERTLITHDRFDDFLNGNVKALSNDEVEGLDLFIKKACTTCHTGPLLGGNMYQKMGLMKPYKDTKDLGRYEVTKNEADKFVFKVPTLRNIALTGPYFHDGGVASLKEAVILMGDIQLNNKITDVEADKIVKFLEALSDKKLATKK